MCFGRMPNHKREIAEKVVLPVFCNNFPCSSTDCERHQIDWRARRHNFDRKTYIMDSQFEHGFITWSIQTNLNQTKKKKRRNCPKNALIEGTQQHKKFELIVDVQSRKNKRHWTRNVDVFCFVPGKTKDTGLETWTFSALFHVFFSQVGSHLLSLYFRWRLPRFVSGSFRRWEW